MNWIRRNGRSRAWAKARTARVLARPGTPSIRTWPPAKSAITSRSSRRSLADDERFQPLDQPAQARRWAAMIDSEGGPIRSAKRRQSRQTARETQSMLRRVEGSIVVVAGHQIGIPRRP